MYANLFVMVVSPPGIGKSLALNKVRKIWKKAGSIKVAPKNTTKASLLDTLEDAQRIVQTKDGMLTYNALQIVAAEFGVFAPAHDMEYLSLLSNLWDCEEDGHDDVKRSTKSVVIDNPVQISLVSGTQPDYLSQFLPEVAWGQGFMARTIMVYSGEIIKYDVFAETQFDPKGEAALIEHAKELIKRSGLTLWTEDAQDVFRQWNASGRVPEPEHLKLKNYNTRRGLQVLKLSLISAASRGNELIEQEDVSRAITWLTDAEATMPEIFKAMKGNSDYGLLQELQLHVTQLFVANAGKPVHETRIVRFLAERTVSWNISKLMEAAERAGIIVRLAATDTWRPGEGKLEPET